MKPTVTPDLNLDLNLLDFDEKQNLKSYMVACRNKCDSILADLDKELEGQVQPYGQLVEKENEENVDRAPSPDVRLPADTADVPIKKPEQRERPTQPAEKPRTRLAVRSENQTGNTAHVPMEKPKQRPKQSVRIGASKKTSSKDAEPKKQQKSQKRKRS